MSFKQVVCWAVAGTLGSLSGGASASGFALLEQNASGMGNAYAGGAAVADDASTIFFNPAGLSRLSGKQLVVAAHAIRPSAKFGNTGSTAAGFQTLGGNGGDAGSWVGVPNAYFAMELSPKMKAGVGLNAPFGLQTQYDANWAGRFQAIKSSIQTVNLSPSFSYEITDAVSIGAGLNYQRISGELTSSTNYSAAAFSVGGAGALAAIGGAGVEGLSTMTGSDSAWGYNLGALFKVGEQTRVGVAYRSRIKYNLTGTVVFANRPAALAAAIPDGPVTLGVTLPESFSASVFHQIDDKWDVMADATMTGWSSFQQLKVLRTNGATVLNVPENWRDTWRIAVGANHHYSEQWTSRMGLSYDQSPVPDAFRTARIPDADRFEIALGGQYKSGRNSAIDFGYAHLFVNNANIADRQGLAKGNLVGSYQNSADILSIQYTQNF
ncbi:MAG TPA: outer membrane protein transport protein [Gallionella sp.]|nr:outer membrane protein transport protein [Gallionella sp.]